MAIALVVFNFIDGGLSWWLIMHLGLGMEANPAMAWLMSKGPLYFLAYKFVLPPIFCAFLYRVRSFPLAKWGLVSLFITYGLLMLWFGGNLLLMLTYGIL